MTELAKLLAAQDRTVGWLARKSGVSRSHLHRCVAGERRLTMRVARAIAPYLGVSPADLVAPGTQHDGGNPA